VDSSTRREFCTQACRAVGLAAVGGALTTALQGCGGIASGTAVSAPTLPVLAANAASGGVTLAVDASSPLATVGGAALVQSSRGSFLVSRTGQEAFTAVTAVCTHQSCTVTSFADQSYVCPCHGSRYDTSGRVVNGPATRALQQFSTQFAGGTLTIAA
jgi:thiosulfate dehydrogenase [quinone] large subunit